MHSFRWQPCLEWDTQGAMEKRVVATWNLKWSRKRGSESEMFLIGEKQKLFNPSCSPSLLKIPDNIYYFTRKYICSYLELALNDINFNPLRLSSFFFLFFMFRVVVTLDYRFLWSWKSELWQQTQTCNSFCLFLFWRLKAVQMCMYRHTLDKPKAL